MSARAAPVFGAVMCLALVRAGPSHALSLRSSAAESFLGDALPGTAVSVSKATGATLRVENSGADPARVEFKLVIPSVAGCRDGHEPWPHPESVRLERKSKAGLLSPGEAAEAELTVKVPADPKLEGSSYEIDVVATGYDRAGASLSLKTRVLLSVGAPLASGASSPGGRADRPGFTVSPQRLGRLTPSRGRDAADAGTEKTLKLVNAGDTDLQLSLTPARSWDDDAVIPEGLEPIPDPRWLRIEPSVVKVRAGAIGSARVWAVVPRETRYAGRKFFAVVAVDAAAGGRLTRRWVVATVDAMQLEEDHASR